MTQTIGYRGKLDIAFAEVGPQRKMRLISFKGRADTGFIAHDHFRLGENPLAVIDVDKGRLVTTSYGGVVTGGISNTDTGGLGADGNMSGHTLVAILADTGTAGL